MRPFPDRLTTAVAERDSQIVVGLDPHPDRVPGGLAGAEDLCRVVIDKAAPACVAVKLQIACFERYGADGWSSWQRLAAHAAGVGLLVIADAKRGDIGLTSQAYAEALLDGPVDALTVNPMMGDDAVEPFITRAVQTGRGVFMLVRTSNPGAAPLQDLELADGRLWHQALAERVAQWGADSVGESGLSAVGAVVGATVPEHLVDLRERMPQQPFLLPGVGAQGGDPADLAPAFATSRAAGLVTASRSIMFAEDPAVAAEELRLQVAAL